MNQIGTLFRLSIFGESHGPAIGAVLDGIPPGLPLEPDDFLPDLSKRKSGAQGTTARSEDDRPHIVSGWLSGHCTGSPLCILFNNTDQRSGDYEALKDWPRPGHADMSARAKYGDHHDGRGSGHFSGRLSLALVAAGTVAKKIINPTRVSSTILEAGGSRDIDAAVREALLDGDSVGALVEVRATNVRAGLGEPFFDSLEGLVAKLVFAVPGVRGVEFGDGFDAAGMRGSEHNDPIVDRSGKTAKNGSGGVNGGITNGNDIVLRVAVKPASSIAHAQTSVNLATGGLESRSVPGRHDACIALRAAVVLEAALAITLADLCLQARAYGRP